MLCNSSDPILTFKNVSFAYDREATLFDVSFTMHRGDYLVVTGENGSGKSTIAKLAIGLLAPDTGSIMFDTKRIGYVAQHAAHIDQLFPATVRDIVSMGVRPFDKLRAGQEEELIANALEHVSLENHATDHIAELSGGERQRVMIAPALASNPEILILDEPTVGVAHAVRDDFYALLHELNTKHCVTILLVTHDNSRAHKDATHVVCVENGGVHYHEDPHESHHHAH